MSLRKNDWNGLVSNHLPADFQISQSVVDVTHQFKDIFQSQSRPQPQPQPQFPNLSQSQKQKQSLTVAEISRNAAFTSSAAAVATSSPSSRVMPPPTDQLSKLSIQETAQVSQSTYHSTQPSQSQFQSQSQSQSQPNTQDTQYTEYTEYTEEATSSLRQHKSLPSRPQKRISPKRPLYKDREQSPASAESSYLSSTPFSSPFITPQKGAGLPRSLPQQWASPSDSGGEHSPIVAAESSNLVSSSPLSLPPPASSRRPTASAVSPGNGGKSPPTTAESIYSSSPFSSPLVSPQGRGTAHRLSAQQSVAAGSPANETSSELSLAQGESSYYSFSPVSSPLQSSRLQWTTLVSGPAEKKGETPRTPVVAPAADSSSYLMSSPFPFLSTPPGSARPRGRLFRSRSGNLVSAAELRRRREAEQHADELLDMILEGFSGGDDRLSKNIVTFCMDEVGRWRILRPDPYEFEDYQEKRRN
ncbi:hypothetical protein Hte_006528 [Hypoxylon texense]